MRHSRFTALHQGMTATAKKVFAVVPIAESWTCAQIMAELRRQGASIDFRVIGGCLAALLSSGLVIEGKPGHYARVRVSDPQAKSQESVGAPAHEIEEEKEVAEVKSVPEKPAQSAIAKLGALSERAIAIGMMLKTLGDDIAKAAIEIDDEAAGREAAAGKIRQLQQLLKEISE